MELANPGRGLLLATMDVDEAYDAELNRWYDEEHLPERVSCSGFLSGRRFRLLEGQPEGQARYLAIYDLESPEVLRSPEYQKMVPPSAWWDRLLPHVRVVRNVYTDVTKVLPEGFSLDVDRP
jgi:hypothetical protein